MNGEDERDYEEEAENRRILETGDGESGSGVDNRLMIAVRKWSAEDDEFYDYQEWVIEEPYTPRTSAEWFGIVTTHVPRDLPVGMYQFALNLPSTMVAAGEFAWDGRVATRREGTSAP